MRDSGRDLATLADVDEVIREDLLPQESYFADYLSLAGDHRAVLLATARAERNANGRSFVSVHEIHRELSRQGVEFPERELMELLTALGDSEQERPLFKRSPSKRDSFQIVIGMLGDHLILEEEL
jgi:hypothetical protein